MIPLAVSRAIVVGKLFAATARRRANGAGRKSQRLDHASQCAVPGGEWTAEQVPVHGENEPGELYGRRLTREQSRLDYAKVRPVRRRGRGGCRGSCALDRELRLLPR